MRYDDDDRRCWWQRSRTSYNKSYGGRCICRRYRYHAGLFFDYKDIDKTEEQEHVLLITLSRFQCWEWIEMTDKYVQWIRNGRLCKMDFDKTIFDVWFVIFLLILFIRFDLPLNRRSAPMSQWELLLHVPEHRASVLGVLLKFYNYLFIMFYFERGFNSQGHRASFGNVPSFVIGIRKSASWAVLSSHNAWLEGPFDWYFIYFSTERPEDCGILPRKTHAVERKSLFNDGVRSTPGRGIVQSEQL